MSKNILIFSILVGGFLLNGCDNEASKKNQQSRETKKLEDTYFQLLGAEQTGIDFINKVEDKEKFNILTYRNFYNGGGGAIGDVNNDSLPDLYFTANLTQNKLYLNKGNFNFEDVTENAGVGGSKGWSTGVTMADVNGDGWMDIYVSNSGDLAGGDKENELFINNGDLTFSEKAESYGLNNPGFSTQAGFFDYDADGDLDCYLLNNSFKDPSKIELYRSMRERPDKLGGDKLYRNDGDKFTDVTTQSGIYSSEIGFGLGAAISDVNNDFLPDIYVSNDFWERDYLYINQGDGTFSEELIDRISMCSIASMGGDIADINNDGHPEIFSTDMLAGDNYRLQTATAFDPYHLEDLKYRANYHYQMLQNCLHLNDGQGKFQEIALMSNVAATDWSWGALIFDFENDGKKDIFVSNGISRDIMSMDFRDFLASNNIYNTDLSKRDVNLSEFISKMPSDPVANFAFKNGGNLRFKNLAEKLGLGDESFSNGAAYGDLDNDGDLDLVVNNVNAPSFIYRNQANETLENHWLKIGFKGYAKNPFGVGAQVNIKTKSGVQTWQNYNSRGFESCVEPNLVFGLGKDTEIESLEVIWPDRKSQVLKNVPVDQVLILNHSNANSRKETLTNSAKPIFTEVSKQVIKGGANHKENRYNDFDHERLLLSMLSSESPRMIKGDVNNDGNEDFLLMGAAGDEDKLFIQSKNGTFSRKRSNDFQISKDFETTCGAFFDHDNDGDLDLMLGSGGNEYQKGNKYFILRYYRNDGKGNFRVDNSTIPQVVGNFSTLETADYDGDGDVDMFLGGRIVPGNYGLPPRSYIFKKEPQGWIEATTQAVAGLGMVTDASWADVDGDKDLDLIVVGDWMGVNIFRNNDGIFSSPQILNNSHGWWTRVEASDLDGDGDMDFVLGNWGTNSKLRGTTNRPLTMYVSDFDQNNKTEFIINWYPPLENRAYPFATKGEITKQLPGLRRNILMYKDYAAKTYETLFTAEQRQPAFSYKANFLESAILWNEGGNFVLKALPIEAQVSPVFGIATHDFDGDGNMDIWLGGNFYGLKPQVGRYDASRGVLLSGNGNKTFSNIPPTESGIYVTGEVRDAMMIKTSKGPKLMVSRNNKSVLIFEK